MGLDPGPEVLRDLCFELHGRLGKRGNLAVYATAGPVDERIDARAPPSPIILGAIALAGCGAAAYAFTAALRNPAVGTTLGEPVVFALLANWITLSYVLCGLFAWWRRPDNRFGAVMVCAGFANFFSTLAATTNEVTFTLGHVLDLLPPVLLIHVFLAFPTGYLRGPLERGLVVSAYTAALGFQLAAMLLGGAGPSNLIEVWASPEEAWAILRIGLAVMSGFCLAAVVLLLRKWHIDRPLRRSVAVLIDVFALGLVMIACLFLAHVFELPIAKELRWATFATLGLAPIAFLWALLNARLARSSLGDLLLELRTEPAPTDLRDALSRALGDPSLELAYWLPDFEVYADLHGRPVEVDDVPGRTTTLIDRDGVHVAALIHDPGLADEPELLDSVRAAAGIALENARLQAELRARLDELRGSRARIVEAAQNERRLLERNLHDGAQQRLIALSLSLSLLEGRIDGDDEARAGIDDARREIAASLGELREIARGIHPAVVSAHGLGVALEQVAARAPIPVDLDVELAWRLPEPVEVAAYYVVAESLANVAKHAQATRARVDVVQVNGELVLEIVDDGIGGADSERGSGIRGLADRVESLNGRLRVWTPLGGGTRVKAEIPCA